MREPSDVASDLESLNRASRSGRVRGGSQTRFWVGIPALFLTTVVLLLAVWALVLPVAMGWKPVAITSGSMYPLIKPGDIVVAAPADGTQLEPGIVIVYEDPVFDGLVSHRIAEVNEDGTYITKGDANASKDSTPISPDAVVGVGRLLVPYIGLVPYWRSTGQNRNLAIAIAAWGLLMMASRWGLLERYNPWTLQSPPLVSSKPRGRHRAPRQHRPRLVVTSISAILSITLIVGVALSAAALTANTSNSGNAFAAANDFSYDAAVLADNPSLWWRLGEAPGGGPSVFTENFEGAFNWITYQSGTFTASTAQAHTGTGSGLKDTNSDPHGGGKQLGFTTGTDWTFEAWIYRPSVYSGGAADRIALEDASFNGYGVMINHSADTFVIERRTNGVGTTISTVAFNPPEDEWYRAVLTRAGSSFSAELYNSGGTMLASVGGSDSTYATANRFLVHGGYAFYVDDITVTSAGIATTVALDTMGNLNGTYVGSPILGQPSLVDGESDTSTTFNGTNWVTIGDSALLNTSTRARRTAELWFRANTTTGRQVLYEEGGSTNGMVIYLEGQALRARAWSASTGWANELDTMAPIRMSIGSIYHVVVTLDTNADPNLILYVNGAPVASASKPDMNDWSTHSDDGGIAAQNGSARYHDGTFGASGTNFFTGTIDDVAIYNTVLPASRVQAHWIAGTP